jgi:hypothetical protein
MSHNIDLPTYIPEIDLYILLNLPARQFVATNWSINILRKLLSQMFFGH